MEKIKYTELIHKYLDGELDEQEKTKLEKRIKEDPLFEKYITEIMEINIYFEKILKNRDLLNEDEKEFKDLIKKALRENQKGRNTKSLFRNKKYLLYAVFFVFCIMIFLLMYIHKCPFEELRIPFI